MAKFLNFNKEKYSNKYEVVNRACLSIIKSRDLENENHQLQRDKINELLGDMFIKNLDVQIYLLTMDIDNQKNFPVSFALFTSKTPGVWEEEMIYTHKKYQESRNAENLFKHAYKNLKEAGAKEVSVSVANRNGRGIAFHNKMLATFAEGTCDNAKTKAEDENNLLALSTGFTSFNFDLTKDFKETKTAADVLTSAAISSAESAIKTKNNEKV